MNFTISLGIRQTTTSIRYELVSQTGQIICSTAVIEEIHLLACKSGAKFANCTVSLCKLNERPHNIEAFNNFSCLHEGVLRVYYSSAMTVPQVCLILIWSRRVAESSMITCSNTPCLYSPMIKSVIY